MSGMGKIKVNFKNFLGEFNTKKVTLVVVVSIIAFLFTPGFLLNLPPVGPPNNDDKVKEIQSFFNFKTNIYSMIVHSIVIGLVFYLFITVKSFYKLIKFQSYSLIKSENSYIFKIVLNCCFKVSNCSIKNVITI